MGRFETVIGLAGLGLFLAYLSRRSPAPPPSDEHAPLVPPGITEPFTPTSPFEPPPAITTIPTAIRLGQVIPFPTPFTGVLPTLVTWAEERLKPVETAEPTGGVPIGGPSYRQVAAI